MHSYKATFSVVWQAAPTGLAIVRWIGSINAIKMLFKDHPPFS